MGFQLGWSGVDTPLWLDRPPPPQKKEAQLTPPPQFLPRLTPRPRRRPRPKIRQKMKMGFLESARRGGSEKSSFAMYLVKLPFDHFNAQKIFGARVHND